MGLIALSGSAANAPSEALVPQLNKIVESYNLYRNQSCINLIDACDEREYVSTIESDMANVFCRTIHKGRSKCRYTVNRNKQKFHQCIAYFEFNVSENGNYWSLDYRKFGRPKIYRPNVKCSRVNKI